MSRVAVTGATGFIGRHVCTDLAAGGHEVLAIVRPGSTRPPPPEARIIRAELDAEALHKGLAGIDAIVHLAGVVSATRDSDYVRANVGGTREVAHAALEAGARLVHVSSLAAAGPAPASSPRSEDDPAAPINAYGRSKLDSEHVVGSMAGLSWIILRPCIVYGPGDRAMLPLFQAARRGVLPLVGRADAAYSFVHVKDVVRAIRAAVSAPSASDTIFVGHPEAVTARQALETIRSAVGTGVLIRVPNLVLRVAAFGGDIAEAVSGKAAPINRRRYAELMAEGFVCRVDRLREHLGVVAHTKFIEGIAQTAAWYRSAGWL